MLFLTTNALFHKEFQCCFAVTALCYIAFENFNLVIHGASQVIYFAIDLLKNLVQVPLPARTGAHAADPVSADIFAAYIGPNLFHQN